MFTFKFQSDTKEEYEKWKTHVESTVNKALTEDEEDLLNSLQEANIANADEQNETDAKVEGNVAFAVVLILKNLKIA